MTKKDKSGGLSRRKFLKTSVAASVALGAGALFAPAVHAQGTIKLGYVSPQTGPLAAFAEADEFIIDGFMETMKGGLEIGGSDLAVEVIVKDSQSNPNRAAEVAKELIVDDEVNLMLVASTPETTNPVSTQCEIEEVPCISTMAPWQPWFIGRQGNPAATRQPGSRSTTPTTIFWGLEDVIAVFTNMWDQLETNKMVGGLFPNDGDGNAWGDPKVGFPPVLDKQRLHAHRSRPLPEPDRRFLGADQRLQERQCRDRHRRGDPARLHHLLEPGQPAGLQAEGGIGRQGDPVPGSRSRRSGKTGNNLSSEVWWSPSHPFKSSLTGQTSAASSPTAFTQGDRPAMDAADRLHPCAVRGGGRRAEARADDPSDAEAIGRGDRRDQARHDRRPDRVGRREPAALRRQERRQDAAGRRPVAAQGRRQVRPRHHRQPDCARTSRRGGKMEPIA